MQPLAALGSHGARGRALAIVRTRRVVASAVASAVANAAASAAALLVALWMAACTSPDSPTESSPVKSVTIAVDFTQITVGGKAKATAVLLDASGNPVTDRDATWTSLTPAILSVTTTGDITGMQAGTGQVRASSGSAGSTITIIVINPLAATIRLARDTATLSLPNGSVQAIPAVTDDFGKAITNPNIVWTSSQPLVATVNVAGLITAVASGSTIINGSIENLFAAMTVTVRPTLNAAAPTITTINPATLRPGGAYIVTGTKFGTTPGANQVLIDGMTASVQTASATQLSIVLPTVGFTCEPARTGFLQISVNGAVGGGAAPLQVGTRRALAIGQTAIVTDGAEVRCNELLPADGRWVVSVYNATRATISPSAPAGVQFAIRGLITAAALSHQRSSADEPKLEMVVPSTALRQGPTLFTDAQVRAEAHATVLERNLAAMRGATLRTAAPGPVLDKPNRQVTAPGTITNVKLPNLDASDFCVSNIPIGARTVFVGAHSVIVEDTIGTFGGRATLRGQMDDYYARLGNEFEAVMWPILTASFGNPLAMDAQLGGSGKVVMVFSPRVNIMQRGSVVGFVANCDLFPVAQKPSSNLGAYFYALVPTSTEAGYTNSETRDQWLRLIRATVIHEVKHVIGFAERTARGFALEDASWEEGTARIAEEMYARTIYGTQVRGNATWAQSIACDIKYLTATVGCADRPILMLRHFDGLYAYMSSPEIYSPLGRTFSGEVAFYAGAWSMLRWASDHFAQSESQFFKDFTTSNVIGASNIEGRTGRPWEESLGEWSLAMYLDDAANYTPQLARMKVLSWNLANMWAGLCADLGPCVNPSNPVQVYGRPVPFIPKARSFGNFLLGVGTMAGGGFTILDLAGPGVASQVIELKSLVGTADPPSSLRLAITRVR